MSIYRLPTKEEELYSYFMEVAADHPAELLKQVSEKEDPTYWENFWACYAAIRLGDSDFAENIYNEYVEDEDDGNNFHLLLAYEKYLEYLAEPENEELREWGADYLVKASERLSPWMHDAFEALRSLLAKEEEEIPVEENFYTKKLFIE